MTVAATTAAGVRRRGNRPAARYSRGPEVTNWIEQHCRIPEGPNVGQPVTLMDWQREWFDDLYQCDRWGRLTYRWALLGIPKGNGKSPTLAWDGIYHLLGDPDEPDPWVVAAATADRQADIVFGLARKTCELSPDLAKATIRYRWEIRPRKGHGKMERVAASGGKLDGKNPSKLLLDELHEWAGETWDVLTNGTVKRERAQIVQGTTAGFDRESICYREYAKCQRARAGEIDLPGYLFRWFEAPPDADYRDPGTWAACNPAYGTLVTEDTLRDQCANKPESVFRRYFLNQWVASETLWLPFGAWANCQVASVELEPGAPTWVGWDASTSIDTTAVVAIQWQGADAARRLVVKSQAWERPMLPDGRPDETWRVPIADVEAYIRELAETYRVREFAFDPAFVTWSAQELEAQGLPMVQFPQTDARMIPATQALYEAIVEGDLAHDGDPTLARHVGNIVAYQVRQGGQRIGKGKQKAPIDCAIALAMAVGAMRATEDKPDGIVLWTPPKRENSGN